MAIEGILLVLVVSGLGCLLFARSALAHCDTTGGPLIPEAKAALEKGDVTPVLKWIKRENETEIKAAFAKAVAVRAEGQQAKELADRYFLETLVRLHRAGEGAPFTGIRDEPVQPIVAMADKALADGSIDAMIEKIGGHMGGAIKGRFQRASEARKRKDESVEAGREYVEAYVAYVHYVEAIHDAIMSTAGHHHAAPEVSAHATVEHLPHQ